MKKKYYEDGVYTTPKKAKKKSQKTKSQFRKRRNVRTRTILKRINEKDEKFFEFMAKASREGRL